MQLSLFTYQEEEGSYFYIWDTGHHGGSGNYKAIPTLLANVFKGINTRTQQIQYYFTTPQHADRDYPTYKRILHYWGEY